MTTQVTPVNSGTIQTKKAAVGLLNTPDFMDRLRNSLPKYISDRAFVSAALQAFNRTPKLLECTPTSFYTALLELSATGLVPDGRNAHLIPYRDRRAGITRCQLIIDYKGLVALVLKAGEVRSITAAVAYENDEFEIELGLRPDLVHKPVLTERGEPVAAYDVVTMKDGSIVFHWMTYADIEATRAKSKAARDGPWITDWAEMAKKTVFKQHSKWLSLTPEIERIIDLDNSNERAPIDDPEAAPQRDAADAAKPVREEAPPETAPKKRKRRTKAEMEAARAAEKAEQDAKDAEAGESDKTPPETNSAPHPDTRSFHEILADLASEAGIPQAVVANHAFELKFTQEMAVGISDLPEETAIAFVNAWDSICPTLLKNVATEKAEGESEEKDLF